MAKCRMIARNSIGDSRKHQSEFMSDRASSIGYRVVALALCSLFLAGCLLTSGERTSADTQPTAGNVSASFVSAEGQSERSIDLGEQARLTVIAVVSVAQGELRIEVLDTNGSIALSVAGRPNEQVTKSGSVQTNPDGQLRYRIVARGARDGSYQLLYQRADS